MRPTRSRAFLRAASAALVAAAFLAPIPARAACCYFSAKDKDINQPGQKAFITWVPKENIEAFTVQPKFEGNALDFGMVIPTPGKPKLDEMPRDFFKDLAIYTILMPLPEPLYPDLHQMRFEMELAAKPMSSSALDGMDARSARKAKEQGVTVLEAGVVGSLDYKIIVAEDPKGLFEWLKENNYNYGGDTGTLDFYISKKWFFTVMKIDSKQMKKSADGSYVGEITPTRFTFESEKCIYPLKITQLSVKDKTDALFYVQSPQQMDLEGDLSWMHSYRSMYLTYMLGCGASPEQQTELTARNEWVNKKRAQDAAFETTKLEWARKLGDAEVSVLEDPLKNYAQMGSELPTGGHWISLEDFIKDAWADYKAHPMDGDDDDYAKKQLKALEIAYPDSRGRMCKNGNPSAGRYVSSPYTFFANRQAPDEDVKGLARLKGQLQKNKWLTKFRKIIRKDEMSSDLVLVPVADGSEQDYVRIMPTSPP